LVSQLREIGAARNDSEPEPSKSLIALRTTRVLVRLKFASNDAMGSQGNHVFGRIQMPLSRYKCEPRRIAPLRDMSDTIDVSDCRQHMALLDSTEDVCNWRHIASLASSAIS
jgi:hypothetical protein